MDIANQRTRKRKQPSLYPSSGTRARGTSELFLHKDLQESSAGDGNGFSPFLIKDLRSRRICYPKPSTPIEDADRKDLSNRGEKDESEKGIGLEIQNFEDLNSVSSSVFVKHRSEKDKEKENEGTEKLLTAFPCEVQNLDNPNSSLSARDQNNDLNDLDEEIVQGTPPDAEIHGCAEPNEIADQKDAGKRISLNVDQGVNVISKTKSVLEPHLQGKLFKTPGSFSYRRMLPFLLNIKEADTDAQDQSLHVQQFSKGVIKKPPQHLLNSPKQEGRDINGCLVNNNVPKSTSPQRVAEFPMCIDTKEAYDSPSIPPATGNNIEKVELCSKDELLSESNIELCSIAVDCCSDGDVENDVLSGSSQQMEIEKTRQPDVMLVLETRNLSDIGPKTSITVKHHSGEENADANVAERMSESALRYSSEANMFKEEKDKASSSVSDGDSINHLDGSATEPTGITVATLPPDSDVFKELDMGHERDKEEVDQKSMVYGLGKPSRGSFEKYGNYNGDRTRCLISKSNMVLNPCKRLKSFRNYGSPNYRRLLPFLADIAEDNSCTSKDFDPKLEKSLEETQTPCISASGCQGMPTDEPNDSRLSPEHHKSNSASPGKAGLVNNNTFADHEPKSASEEIRIPPLSHDSEKEHQLQDVQPEFGENGNSGCLPSTLFSIEEIDPPVPSGALLYPREVISEEDAEPLSLQSSLNSDVNCSSSVTGNSCKIMSQHKPSVSPKFPAEAPMKGILRRNPRGCRGLCTCLDCASFRLHAERAFEFSRNQMLDAEEVAFDLIKELSYLRSMLGRSAGGANDRSIVHANEVKEACKKAFEAEELAKSRVSQLNNDLKNHCRITCLHPPRVRFANHVEEQVFLKAESPIKRH